MSDSLNHGHKATVRKHRKWYSQLLLLLWKNFLLRKRHWLLTLFELGIPTLLFSLLVSIRVLPDSIFQPVSIDDVTLFDAADEVTLRKMYCNNTAGWMINDKCRYLGGLYPGDRAFFWGPNNTFTKKLVELVVDDLNWDQKYLRTVDSNEEMNDLVNALYLQSSESYAAVYTGLFFHLANVSDPDPPRHLSYDLRMQKYWMTDYIFPYMQVPGPRNFTASFVGSYSSGFTLLQTLVDRHYTALITEQDDYADTVQMETQMYPYPPYVQDYGMSQFYGTALPTFIVLSLVMLCPSLIKSIVHEKETGVRELVRLMGLSGRLVWLGWFLHSFVMVLAIAAIMTLFLKVEVTPTQSGLGMIPPILINTDWFLLWLLLALYGVSSIAFCFAVSCFFTKPTLATTLGILAWLVTYFIPKAFMEYDYDTLGLSPKLFSCLLPNMAITWAFRIISMFEGRAVGLQWHNLWETGNPRDELTPAIIYIMLVVDTLMYFLITWYFDQVLPGIYGVPQKWYFPIQRSYWCHSKQAPHNITKEEAGEDEGGAGGEGGSNGVAGSGGNGGDGMDQGSNFEAEPRNHAVGIAIRNLRKEFPALGGGVKVAVEDVTLTCYEGQCTVLLGHNGAGKTTTMSVITGVYPATAGRAEILGWDISTHLDEARERIGLCPQHNTLFADLTVEEHLLFFAQLKGLSRSEAKAETKDYLQKMQLTDKFNQFGNQLSGGMKRKLCLCIALIGGSEVVILDEPSSGLDPESRRWVWDVVQRERGHRTLLVTTHHMEEADVLGDRVAIMASGKVVCAGSTLFLKNRFGEGYSLRVLPTSDCDVSAVTALVIKHLPGSHLASRCDGELVYKLAARTAGFAPLLERLAEDKKSLGVQHVGISLTSMEQVFLKVGELVDSVSQKTVEAEALTHSSSFRSARGSVAHAGAGESEEVAGGPWHQKQQHNQLQDQQQQPYVLNDGSRSLCSSQMESERRLSGGALLWERLKVLWTKRVIYSRRKWVLLLTQGLIPVAVTIMCLAVDASYFGENSVEGPRKLELEMFEWSNSSVQDDTLANLTHCYERQFRPPYEVYETDNVTKLLLQAGAHDLFHYRENYVTSALFYEDNNVTVARMLYQSVPFHAPGVGINLVDNALLRCVAPDRPALRITTYNYPLPTDKTYLLEDGATSASSFLYSMMMPIALAFLSASFLVFPLEEREAKAKQIQVMTGTPVWMLWLTSFTWDMLTYSISALLIFACFVIIDAQGYFTLYGAPGALLVLLFLYGWSSLPLAYVFSFPFTTAASGFAILALFNIVTGMLVSTATWALSISEQPNLLVLSSVLGNISSLIPAYPASKAFKNLVDMGTYNTQCNVIQPELVEAMCESLVHFGVQSPFLSCCPQCSVLENVTCFQPLSYLQWDTPGMGVQLAWMAVDGFIYILLILALEMGLGDFSIKLYSKCRNLVLKRVQKVRKPAFERTQSAYYDDDVAEEARRAREMMQAAAPDAAMVVDGLTKEYLSSNLIAVDNVSFVVGRGECFGLLGVNGAGKTSIFKMLTGDELLTSGNARIGDIFLNKQRIQFVNEIGYCPQFDAVLDELTGEEMLHLLGGLRGVPWRQRQHLVQELMQLVDLSEHASKLCRTYSGGNKRKLSTAMALVGAPQLVFLDEPTTGVDPASRRRVWAAIKAARANGQAIILTSHSMDECEALCSKIVILRRGQLTCVGTPQHIKAKFGHGYSLQVKLQVSSFEYSSREHQDSFNFSVARLRQIIQEKLPGATLTDQHRGMLSYRVPSTISWSQLFYVMEDLKNNTSDGACLVEDYAATDPSLEQVFLSFARDAELQPQRVNELVTKL